ncbi:MAG: peptidylprolyl isomerase [Bacteroidota bacterium]
MRKFLPVLLLCMCSMWIVGCGNESKDPNANDTSAPAPANLFSDENMRNIYEAANTRDAAALADWLDNDTARYRRAAAMGFGSVQNSTFITALATALNDSLPEVADAAAWSLGQTGHPSAVDPLQNALMQRFSPTAAEALGKCARESDLAWLVGYAADRVPTETEWEGIAMGLYQFSLRKIVSQESCDRLMKALGDGPLNAQNYAGAALGRVQEFGELLDFEALLPLFKKVQSVDAQQHLVRAFRHCKTPECQSFIGEKIVPTPTMDYRIRINALRALQPDASEKALTNAHEMAQDPLPQLATAAAQWIRTHSKWTPEQLLEAAETMSHPRAKQITFASALRRIAKAANTDKEELQEIAAKFRPKRDNAAERYAYAEWLLALGEHPEFTADLIAEVQKGDDLFAGVAMQALSSLFTQFPAKRGEEKRQRADFLSECSLSEDIAVLAQMATLLRDPQFEGVYTDTVALKSAITRLKMPRDVEIVHELEKTIAKIRGEENPTLTPVGDVTRINWELVQTIPATQKAIIETSEGKITWQLYVEKAPHTVSNFVQLARDGFYDGKSFHRVVPNFVAQGGCPRGDGWGSTDGMIRSEWPEWHYEAGSVGMASAGKDTESCQWFITHGKTPHLDGRYTIFAEVTEGMDVVKRLGVGSSIIKVSVPGAAQP